MKIKKFEEMNENIHIDEDEHHVSLIASYLFNIQDNFHKLSNNKVLLRALKNDLSSIIDRYNLKN